jgi:response regulator RpfG family c-di-GMP phosphodiesterase
MTSKVLCVDDDANILSGIQRNLRKQFDIETAVGSLAALKILESGTPYAVIVADMQMPGMNGIELLNIARQKYPDTIRVMLTGNADQHTATEAVNKGYIFQFLNKPCSPDKLGEVLKNGIKQHRLITAERELLENTLNGSVKVLMEILSLTDPASFGRSQGLRDQARRVGQAMKLQSLWEIELAAMLAQIGIVSVPPIVNQKARAKLTLTAEEKEILRRIPQVGSDLLANIPRLQPVARIVLYQDKNYDGSGLPADAVSKDEIPLESRILKAIQALAPVELDRVAWAQALEKMRAAAGVYDPAVLDVLGGYFDLAATAAAKPGRLGVSFENLRPGQVLASDINTREGVMVIGAGTRLTPLIMERLRNFASITGLEEPIFIEGNLPG